VKEQGQGGPDQKPTRQRNNQLKEAGKTSPGFPTLKPEQQPRSGGINKPELHPPKEILLSLKPNSPGHEQQPANLDPELEELIRAYADTMGDSEEEKRSLFERYKKDSSTHESFKTAGRFNLTISTPEIRIPKKNQGKQ
jgi:hypothetical protein